MDEPTPWLLGGIGVEGNQAANAIAAQADVVVCVGTRLADFVTGSRSLFADPGVRFVSINVDARDAAKMGASAVVGDAREALRELAAAVAETGRQPDPAYALEVEHARDRWGSILSTEVFVQHPGERLSQGQLIGVMNEQAQRGDIIVTAAGGPPGDIQKLWDATHGRECHIEFGNSCMGHEIPAALGMRWARPAGEVIAYVGDGTYLMNPSEIVTAVQDGLKVTIVIVDNGGFQVIRRLQLARIGRPFGNEFRSRDASDRLEGDYLSIDLAANAASLGARTWSVETEAELRTALDEARAHDGVSAIVVTVERHRFLPSSGSWWDAAPPETSTDASTRSFAGSTRSLGRTSGSTARGASRNRLLGRRGSHRIASDRVAADRLDPGTFVVLDDRLAVGGRVAGDQGIHDGLWRARGMQVDGCRDRTALLGTIANLPEELDQARDHVVAEGVAQGEMEGDIEVGRVLTGVRGQLPAGAGCLAGSRTPRRQDPRAHRGPSPARDTPER